MVQFIEPKSSFDPNATIHHFEFSRAEDGAVTEIAIFTMPDHPKFIVTRCSYEPADEEPGFVNDEEFETLEAAYASL